MKGVRRSNRLRALVLFLGVLVWTAVPAAQMVEGVPLGLFEAQGTMRYLDLPAGIVLIDGKRYRISSNLKLYGLNTEESLMRQVLRAVNREVAYIVGPEKNSPTISAIWILDLEGR